MKLLILSYLSLVFAVHADGSASEFGRKILDEDVAEALRELFDLGFSMSLSMSMSMSFDYEFPTPTMKPTNQPSFAPSEAPTRPTAATTGPTVLSMAPSTTATAPTSISDEPTTAVQPSAVPSTTNHTEAPTTAPLDTSPPSIEATVAPTSWPTPQGLQKPGFPSCDTLPSVDLLIFLEVEALGSVPLDVLDTEISDVLDGQFSFCDTRRDNRRLQGDVLIGDIELAGSSTETCSSETPDGSTCTIVNVVIPLYGDTSQQTSSAIINELISALNDPEFIAKLDSEGVTGVRLRDGSSGNNTPGAEGGSFGGQSSTRTATIAVASVAAVAATLIFALAGRRLMQHKEEERETAMVCASDLDSIPNTVEPSMYWEA